MISFAEYQISVCVILNFGERKMKLKNYMFCSISNQRAHCARLFANYGEEEEEEAMQISGRGARLNIQ